MDSTAVAWNQRGTWSTRAAVQMARVTGIPLCRWHIPLYHSQTLGPLTVRGITQSCAGGFIFQKEKKRS